MATGECWIKVDEDPPNGEWLIKLINDEQDQRMSVTPSKLTQIQNVVTTLRDAEWNKGCFDPLVVSFGPYHHGKDGLKPMESCKAVAAHWFVLLATGKSQEIAFITEQEAKNLYEKFVIKLGSPPPPTPTPREWYSNMSSINKFNNTDFMKMMFLDGCFILYFIHFFVKESLLLKKSRLNGQAIIRDMFLLENQIPYTVLKALMSLIPNQSIGSEIDTFIDIALLHKSSQPTLRSSADKDEGGEPCHLLDLLRSKFIGSDDGAQATRSTSNGYGYGYYPFRSIMELKAQGIQVSLSNSNNLKDINLQEGVLYGYLNLPQITINDNTKTLLLNLIAYEMCPDSQSDRAVITYICFLNSLIADDHRVTEDVKELRSKKILINFTGGDQEVARLFNDLARNLMPNVNIYNTVMNQIDHYSKNRVKGPISNFLHTHFRSPWTIIIFIAGKLTVVSSVIQGAYYVSKFHR